MRVLFIGGTGNLSWACTEEALARGHEVVLVNRGSRPAPAREGLSSLVADIADVEAVRSLLEGESFDAVVDWVAYKPEDVRRDIGLFRGKASQYVLISTASAYQKPPRSHIVTESTPLANPYWQYSRDKIECESVLAEAYRAELFPGTVVRPSHTYGPGWIPSTFGSSNFNIAQRIIDGREIVVPGDGQSLWTLTWAADFAKGLVGLLGLYAAVGEAFHITSDEALTWDSIYRAIGEALGREPRIVHIASDFIASMYPEFEGPLLGDKSVSAVFDNSKIKRLVPAFRCETPFSIGVRKSIAWLASQPDRKKFDPELDAKLDAIIGAYRKKLP